MLLLAAAGAAPAVPQGLAPAAAADGTFFGGTYVNFESPQCKPLALAEVGEPGAPDLVLCVANTADATIEIYKANTASRLPVLADRIRVGLDPVSVVTRQKSEAGKLVALVYSANMVGDSVSLIRVESDAGTLSARLVRTVNAGDEPMHMAVFESAANPQLVVSLGSRGAVTALHADTLATLTPDPPVPINATIPVETAAGVLNDLDVVIARPRTVAILGQGPARRLYVLGSRGSHHDWPGIGDDDNANTTFQREAAIDLWCRRAAGQGETPVVRRALGTRNFNMAFDSDGACWVVSGDAANVKQKGKASVRSEPTGFLRTLLHVIPDPTVAGGPVHSRDLNRVTTAGGRGAVVSPADSLSHAVDVAVLESGATYKVYVAALHSDKVGVISGVKSGGSFVTDGNLWSRSVIDVRQAGANSFAGPSGIVVRAAGAAAQDPGAVGYVLLRAHASIEVLDLASDTSLGNVPLANDPTPKYVKAGRKWLYKADRGNGFNSCASCHFSGRTDFLRWDLSDDTSAAPFSNEMVAALENPLWEPFGPFTYAFSQPKGEFITQTLQGLVVSEVADPLAQRTWFGVGPLHWDGDMPGGIADFNAAFPSLLGGTELNQSQLAAFVKFVESIHFPPNPEQNVKRRLTGDLGDPHDESTGSGSLRGMKLFHTRPIIEVDGEAGRSCAQCHAFPAGTNSLLTEQVPAVTFTGLVPPIDDLPLKTVQLKGMWQKEALHFSYAFGTTPRFKVGGFNTLTNDPNIRPSGLHLGQDFRIANAVNHAGRRSAINTFNNGFRARGDFDQAESDLFNQFNREFDTGMAPMVGVALSVEGPGATVSQIRPLLQQVVRGNVEVAVLARLQQTRTGFFYDPPFPAGPVEQGRFTDVRTGSTLTPAALLALPQTGDLLVFEAVPLGTGRRLADPRLSPPSPPASLPPSGVRLESMVPNTSQEQVMLLEKNWDPLHATPGLRFVWTPPVDGRDTREPYDLKAVRLMQAFTAQGRAKNHPTSKRLRVSGRNIRRGAKLRIGVPMSVSGDGVETYHFFELPIFPTPKTGSGGEQVWITAAELPPAFAHAFAVGGWWAPGVDRGKPNSVFVRAVVTDPTNPNVDEASVNQNPSILFDPATWNRFFVEVINEDGTRASAADQAMRIEGPGFSS